MTDDRSPPASGPAAGQETVVPVRFQQQRRAGFYRPSTNSYKLVGEGTIAIGSAEIVINGKRPVVFGIRASKSVTVTLSAIVNVEQCATIVRFDVAESYGRRHMMLWCASEADAARLAQSLPDARTAEFHPVLAERAEFETLFDQVAPRAYVTPALVAINVAIFIAMALKGAGVFDVNGEVHVAWGSNYGPLTLSGEWWRLLTSTFLHFGILHLLVNMYVLWDVGRFVERLYGSRAYVVIYFGAGLLGSIASLAWNPVVNSAGASGAIFGVVGAMLAAMTGKSMRLPVSVAQAHRNSMLVFVLFNLANGLSHAGIDNAAHVGGLVGGFLIGFVLRRPLDPQVRATSDTPRVLLTALVATAVVAGLTLPLKRANAGLVRDEQARAELRWFLAGENANLETFKQVSGNGIASEHVNAEFADRIERDVKPFWDQASERLHAHQQIEDRKLAGVMSMIDRYAGLKKSAMDFYVRGGRAGDVSLVEQGDGLMRQANRLMDEYQEEP